MDFGKVGLVLSGGGTKGIAHAGVLKFLAEKNIDIDVLSCCSAGSIVGCLHAVGKTPEEILEFFNSVYFFNWKHFAFNQPGLVSSVIFRNYLNPIFGEMKLGDLDKDVRIVATELVRGTEKIFEKSFKIVDAIIASCSIPGVTTPYIIDDEMYCDGGVLNNFPADIIRDDCDKLIGVFVSPRKMPKLMISDPSKPLFHALTICFLTASKELNSITATGLSHHRNFPPTEHSKEEKTVSNRFLTLATTLQKKALTKAVFTLIWKTKKE